DQLVPDGRAARQLRDDLAHAQRDRERRQRAAPPGEVRALAREARPACRVDDLLERLPLHLGASLPAGMGYGGVVTHVRFLGPDPAAYVASVERHAAEFEEQTGLELDVRIIPSDEYFSNRIHHLLDGEEAADVYMSGPVLVWEHVAAGYVEPLDPFLNRYDADDFVDRLLASNRWSGRFGDPLRAGPLLEIPANCESYTLAYVPALLEDAGLAVPSSWGEYFDAARTVARRPGGVRGFGQRGTDAWHTMYTGFATQLWSYGGADFVNGR